MERNCWADILGRSDREHNTVSWEDHAGCALHQVQVSGTVVKSLKLCISILREVNATFQGSHLIFTAMGGTSCFSNVGRVGGIKGQLVNLGSLQCLHQGVVIHETLHALGSSIVFNWPSYWTISGAVHEHTRPDRDLHVRILLENVQPGQEHNFQKVSNDTHNTGNTPFDYKSIMIYGAFDFGIENSSGSRKRTIEPLKSGVEIRCEWYSKYCIYAIFWVPFTICWSALTSPNVLVSDS